MRNLLSIALVVLVFFGSLGIPLYEHTCLYDDSTIRTLFVASGHCEKMCVSEAVIPGCCTERTTEEVKQNHCCKEAVTRLAMAFSFFENVHLQATIIPQGEVKILHFLSCRLALPVEKRPSLITANNDPPPISGRDRLSRICILRL